MVPGFLRNRKQSQLPTLGLDIASQRLSQFGLLVGATNGLQGSAKNRCNNDANNQQRPEDMTRLAYRKGDCTGSQTADTDHKRRRPNGQNEHAMPSTMDVKAQQTQKRKQRKPYQVSTRLHREPTVVHLLSPFFVSL